MNFNPFIIMTDFTEFILSIGRFFAWFSSYEMTVGQYTFTPFTIFSVGGGAFILAIIIRAIVRAVAV